MTKDLLWLRVKKEMEKHSSYGQFHHDGVTTGAWFITLCDATDVAVDLIEAARLGERKR
jgi:hypothetical protein